MFNLIDCKTISFLFIALTFDIAHSQQPSDQKPVDISPKLKAAIEQGPIKIELKDMSPTDQVRGLRWSPKGTQFELKQEASNDGFRRFTAELNIGNVLNVPIQLTIEHSDDPAIKPGNAILKADLDHDGKFSQTETTKVKPSTSRGKIWYSSTLDLTVQFDDKSRAYPIAVWYVFDPDEPDVKPIMRWSRRGWHQGTAQIGGKEAIVVLSDRNADGIFTQLDAWGLAATTPVAYSSTGSANAVNSHAWFDDVPYRVETVDPNGQFIVIRAFDLGMTQEEDKARKDPYREDRKYKRAEKPVQFGSDLSKALAEAKSSNKNVLVDFVTEWCGPCKIMDQLVYTAEPMVDRCKSVVTVKLDGDKEKELVKKYEVTGYPTLLLLNAEGEILDRKTGYQSVKSVMEMLDKGK